ncbi:MAG TPA: sugar phosphate nucleotidyltransferase [Pyrinomonadaceae bacterium]|nr:sugar phosphate nucleotidyltransferase [Pyrinomonadaceae bacterium]
MPAYSLNRRVSREEAVRRFSPARPRHERWAVILAGGDGIRLRSMTRAIAGDDRPKQFCPLIGGRTLLDQTRDRAALSVSPNRTLFVVTEKHQRFYQPLAATLSKDLLVAQPDNKGTAPAILYALLRVAAKSPQATVALFPSDHYFADDEAFMSYVDLAFDATRSRPEIVTLLGITPSSAETEYGWIEPVASILSNVPRSITRVQRFWEKPSASVAGELMQRGCLWNSFVMVGRVDALLKMTHRALPDLSRSFATLVPSFSTGAERFRMAELYSKISETNFSHEVLATRPNDLAVMRVGEVGWSDLGEPTRVLSTLAQIGIESRVSGSMFQVSSSQAA